MFCSEPMVGGRRLLQEVRGGGGGTPYAPTCPVGSYWGRYLFRTVRQPLFGDETLRIATSLAYMQEEMETTA